MFWIKKIFHIWHLRQLVKTSWTSLSKPIPILYQFLSSQIRSLTVVKMQQFKKPKIVFSPSNVDHYEGVFWTEYDIALGYQARTNPELTTLLTELTLLSLCHQTYMLSFAIGLNIISKPDLIVLESQVGCVPANVQGNQGWAWNNSVEIRLWC